MLTNLKIENVAVIEKAEITFDNGLNILTGETGAGKSIVIDSINAILGERISKDIVRTGSKTAKVTAFFENISNEVISLLNNFEVECEIDNTLLVSRIITADGRSSCRVNGQIITATMLKTIGRELISICGQHDSQHLLSTDFHSVFIKQLANEQERLEKYKQLYREVVSLNKKLNSLLKNEEGKERQLEYLQFQIEELANANIRVGEKDELTAEKNKILNREKIVTALSNAKSCLEGSDGANGVVDLLYNLSNYLTEIADYDENFSSYIDSIGELQYLLSDCSSVISSNIENFDGGFSNIDEIENRLDVIYRVTRKYGGDEENCVAYFEKISKELEELTFSDEVCEKLELELDEKAQQLKNKADEISEKRQKVARVFQSKVQDELVYLDMPNARFEVCFNETELKNDGYDEIEFSFSANSGQSLKPLAKIASGGELSRVMLAIKSVLSDYDSVQTMIFDEIDMGVSGRAAQKIAFKLKNLAQNNQILCVTHLAQIASHADNHLLIEKTSNENETYTNVTTLSEEQRIKEIARIIGGDIITQVTLNSAKELIDFANLS
ncbi:MAG: DNA repair protein RecN [Clostridia bacterium]